MKIILSRKNQITVENYKGELVRIISFPKRSEAIIEFYNIIDNHLEALKQLDDTFLHKIKDQFIIE